MENTPAPEQAAPSATPLQSAAPVSEVSLEDFLSEFERETAPKQAAPTEQPAQQPDLNALANDPFGPISNLGADALKAQVNYFGQTVQELMAREQHRQNVADFNGVISKAENLLKQYEIPVGKDFVERYLRAESTLDPALTKAWDERHLSPEHARQYARHEKKALERLIVTARREPDPDLTADRWAVAAAIRGSAHGPPEERPVDVTTLSEPEFRNLLRTKWGL